MDFGKLPNIEAVDFRLPADATFTTDLFETLLPSVGLPKVYVGATGWSMPQWVGRVYPKNTKSKDFLLQYGLQFNTIEHNTTHYRIPDKATVYKWRTETPDDFRFCPKIPQTISHSRDLGLSTKEISLFVENISLLEHKLGMCFMQMPPHFEPKSLSLLETFLTKWDKKIPLAIEVRHESFFQNTHKNAPSTLFDLLAANGVATVITDVAGRRDVLHQTLTTNTAMIRFVGNGLHPTDYERIDEWVARLKQWFEAGLEQVFFFTHEPDNLLSPELAVYTVECIKKSFEAQVRAPNLIEEKIQQQFSLF